MQAEIECSHFDGRVQALQNIVRANREIEFLTVEDHSLVTDLREFHRRRDPVARPDGPFEPMLRFWQPKQRITAAFGHTRLADHLLT